MGPLSTYPRRDDRGYTLIELLVVAAIVGVLVSVAALTWRNDPARTLEAEAQRLAGKLELALARARIGGSRLAFAANADEYVFWQRDAAGRWREIETDTGLARRALTAGVHISGLQFGGMAMPLGQHLALSADDEAALSITLDGAGMRATVANGPYAGQMAVRVARSEP